MLGFAGLLKLSYCLFAVTSGSRANLESQLSLEAIDHSGRVLVGTIDPVSGKTKLLESDVYATGDSCRVAYEPDGALSVLSAGNFIKLNGTGEVQSTVALQEGYHVESIYYDDINGNYKAYGQILEVDGGTHGVVLSINQQSGQIKQIYSDPIGHGIVTPCQQAVTAVPSTMTVNNGTHFNTFALAPPITMSSIPVPSGVGKIVGMTGLPTSTQILVASIHHDTSHLTLVDTQTGQKQFLVSLPPKLKLEPGTLYVDMLTNFFYGIYYEPEWGFVLIRGSLLSEKPKVGIFQMNISTNQVKQFRLLVGNPAESPSRRRSGR